MGSQNQQIIQRYGEKSGLARRLALRFAPMLFQMARQWRNGGKEEPFGGRWKGFSVARAGLTQRVGILAQLRAYIPGRWGRGPVWPRLRAPKNPRKNPAPENDQLARFFCPLTH